MTECGNPPSAATVVSSRRDRLILLAGAAVAVAVRLFLSRESVGPIVVADEAAYLSMARYLAGLGEPWMLGGAAAYSIGYSIVIAPLFRLFGDPSAVYRSIMVLNAVLGGILVLVFRSLARRLTDLGTGASVVLATVAACLPSIVIASARAWSDALAPLMFALLLLTTLRLLERPDSVRALTLVSVHVAAYAVHNRFLPLVVITIAVLVGTAVSGDRPAWRSAGAVGLLLIGLALVRWLTVMIHDPLYGPGGAKVKVDAAVRVFRFGPLVLSGVGQLWYLVAATAGVAGIGIVHLLRTGVADLNDRRRGRISGITSAGIWVVTAHIFLSIAISVVFMTDRPGAQRLIYGRYNDALIGVLFVIGTGVLLSPATTNRRRIIDFGVTASTMIGFALLLVGYRSGLLGQPFANSVITGILPLHAGGPNAVNRITALSLVLGAFLVLTTLGHRWRAYAFAVPAIALVVAGLHLLDEQMGFAKGERHATIGTAPLDAGDEVRIDTVDGLRNQSRFKYPFFAPDIRFEQIRSEPFERKLELVLSGMDPTEPNRWGYRMLWADPMAPNAIWLAPGPRQKDADRRGELLPPEPLGPAPGDDRVVLEANLEHHDGRIRGHITIDRPDGGPWIGAGRDDLPMRGRIRVRAEIRSDRDREPITTHVDLGRFVGANESQLRLLVDLPVESDWVGPVTMHFQTIRVGDGTIGAPLEIELS